MSRLSLAIAASLSLVAAPVAAHEGLVHRWPLVPDEVFDHVGTVALVVQVLGVDGWATVDGLVVVPSEDIVCALTREDF